MKTTPHNTNPPQPNNNNRKLKKPSNLSRGPKNPNHKTFLHNESRIGDALCVQISKRRIDIKAKEIYLNAGITSPTFYLHYHSSNDARFGYEQKLIRNLYRHMPSNPKPEVVYILLTKFIAKNQKYFLATAVSGDHYLLSKIIANYRHILVGTDTTDRTFRHYRAFVIVTINCWLQIDGVTPETTKACSARLAKIRPLRYWD